jgi:hypothetical protein
MSLPTFSGERMNISYAIMHKDLLRKSSDVRQTANTIVLCCYPFFFV